MALDEQAGHADGARPRAPGEPVGTPAAGDSQRMAVVEPSRAGSRRVGRRRAAGPARERIAANDDAPSIGGLIYALEQRPSNRPFMGAAIASAAWGLLGTAIAAGYILPALAGGASLATVLLSPAVLIGAVAIAVPIAFFWLMASLMWRIGEMRLMSTAMSEVAVRLVEPDRLAEDQIASLGKSVRLQVSAFNDGISRAIGRAGELETLVDREVTNLDRSYSENEQRIRRLTNELGAERDALANMSGNIGEELRGIGGRVSQEIFAAGDQVARNLAEAGAAVAAQLSDKGNALYASLAVMHDRVGVEVPALLEKLGHEQTRLTRIVETAAKNLTALETALSQRAGSLEASLGGSTERLRNVLEDYTSAAENTFASYTDGIERRSHGLEQTIAAQLARVEDALTSRNDMLDQVVVERTRGIDAAFIERIRTFDDHVARGAQFLDRAVSDRAGGLREALESQARQLEDVVGRGLAEARRTSEMLTGQAVQTLGGLSTQSKVLREVSEELLVEIRSLTDRFESQTNAMLRAAQSLDGSPRSAASVREAASSVRRTMQDSVRAIDALQQYARGDDDRSRLPPVADSLAGGQDAGGSRRGWLNELLTSASRFEDQGRRSAPRADESAGGLDLNAIASSIDPDSAAEIWSRYRRGERGLFSRHIYTRSGQTHFDEIKERIRSDAGFRAMADRYLSDFELMLREAERQDPGGRQVQNHLVAPQGRVYLLLAHASDRLQ